MLYRKKIQRGYNLVEIAIVLTVSIMLTYWLAADFIKIDKEQRNEEARDTVELIKDAIVDYAISHRTKSYMVINSLAPSPQIIWRTPTNRPYLPCPDITGDGIEDRISALSTTLTLSVGLSSSDFDSGGCYRNKGLVPWKTLNTPPADPWGNRYTYRVDENFTNDMIGFDQFFSSGDVYYTRLLTLSVSPTLTIITQVEKPLNSQKAISPSGEVASRWSGSILSEKSSSIICNTAPCSRQSPLDELLQGQIEFSQRIVKTGQYRGRGNNEIPVYGEFSANHISSGLPIVVLSHGENGYGAVAKDDRESMICRDIPQQNLDERQNAYSENTLDATVGDAVYDCPPVVLPGGKQNGFVSRPPVDYSLSAGLEEFDDVVGWMSTEELMGALHKHGVFPVDLLLPIGLED